MRTLGTHALAAAAAALCIVVAASVTRAADPDAETDLVRATLLADAAAVKPGGSFMLGVRLKMKPHWHTYWVNPGETGQATQVAVTGPAGFTFGPVRWPLPTKIDAPGGVSFGYEDEVLLIVPVTVSESAKAGADAPIKADVSWLVCKETCIEGNASLSLSLAVGDEAKPANQHLFDTWLRRLPAPGGGGVEAAEAAEALSSAEHKSRDDGGPSTLTVRWKQTPKNVEWFPVSTPAVSIDKVEVRHDGGTTEIRFKPTVYEPEQIPGGRVDSVLVFEDADGRRRGVTVPLVVSKAP